MNVKRGVVGLAHVAIGLALTAALATAAVAQSRFANCTVARLAGNATIERAGATLPAATGMRLNEDDRATTAAGAKLEIICGGGSGFILGPETSLALSAGQSFGRTQAGAIVELLRGIVRLVVPQVAGSDRFEVVTETAIASVRSTVWTVEAKPGNTAVFVVDGLVLVTGRATQAAVLLQPGFGSDVNAGAAPTAPVRWGAPRVESALSRTSFR